MTGAMYPGSKQSMLWNNSGENRTHCMEKKADKMSYVRGASLLVPSLYQNHYMIKPNIPCFVSINAARGRD